MCSVIRTHFALLLLASAAFAREPLTVVAEFDGSYSRLAVKEMQTELQSLMANSGLSLNWRLLSDVAISDSFPDLVVVRFHGACDAKSATRAWSGKPAALAYTHVSDGQVLPFTEVDCDEIHSFVSARSGGSAAPVGDLELGRALGRVMAHELQHILTQSRSHSRDGIARRALTSAELTGARLDGTFVSP